MPSADPYASHLPVLGALADILPMERVLEFGMGRHSTRFFQRQADHLVSVESDPKWARSFFKRLEDFDLVFIDDGKSAEERAQTIRWALKRSHPPLVIHDAEVPEYADLIESTDHSLYGQKPPYTVVVW